MLRKTKQSKRVTQTGKGASFISQEENWYDMQKNPDTIEILSERDSPLRLVAIEEEVASMRARSSTKREAQNPISPVSQKR